MESKAYLILENGKVFEGKSFGAKKETTGELVFTTAMTGYLETLTDPSYFGQVVIQTFPLIGNYGVIPSDFESKKPALKAYIVRNWCQEPSNFRCEGVLDTFLKDSDVPGLYDIDTRCLTRIVREYGVMNCKLTYSLDNLDKDIEELKSYKVTDAVKSVTTDKEELFESETHKKNVVLMDFGAKKNIARSLNNRGCEVTVYPAYTKAEEILESNPDGIMLSNGPGDPKECVEIIEEIKKLYNSNVPIFAICLGHQLMALATGADTHRLKYGHRGANHPVKDLKTGKCYISSQNHGYVVDESTLDSKVAVPAFENVNDKTNEGLEYVGKNIFTVQFHPEACAGPQDTAYLFDRFMDMMKKED